MAARSYEFYFRMVKYCCCFFYHEKIKFIPLSHRIIFFLLYGQKYFCTNNSVRAGNDVINILTSEDMENTPLESRM